MSIVSHVLGSGNSPLATSAICGGPVAGLTATGSSATDALQLNTTWSQISTAAASTGVKLMKTEPGNFVAVANDGANSLTVYPQSGSTIDGGASVAIAAGKRRFFIGTSDTTWVSILGA